MKILKLRFENLNSLAGKWEIDFTHPEYMSNGIFAITGPTGAGKSTILDAICLALYGKTPRLARINSSSNGIMSRRTGECYAEVEFETNKGCYRINWSQRRSRGKSDGALQAQKHILYDAAGKALEEKKRAVEDKIEELTGMDFDRFTRSMLLAQGGFAAFLQASADERAPILEEITGTDIYSQISILVHEENNRKKQALEVLEAEIRGIEILPEDAREELQKELKINTENENKLKVEDKAVGDSLVWLKRITELKKESEELEKQSKILEEENKQFRPEREILARAEKAAEIDADFAVLKEKRANLAKNETELSEKKQNLPQVDEKLKKAVEEALKRDNDLKKVRTSQSEELKILKDVRAVDGQIANNKSKKKEIADAATALNKDLAEKKNDILTCTEKVEKINSDLKKAKEYIKNNSRDEKLTSLLPALSEKLKNLDEAQAQLAELRKQITESKNEITQTDAEYKSLQEREKQENKKYKLQLAEIEKKKLELQSLLDGKLLREFRNERDAKMRERVLVGKIVNLEADRKQLEDGKPCPLCGSETHPFAVGNVPEIDSVEIEIKKLDSIITKAESLEKEIAAMEKTASLAKDQITETGSNIKLLLQKTGSLKKTLEKLQTDEAVSLAKLAEIEKEISANLADFSYDKTILSDTAKLMAELNARLEKWNKQKTYLEECEKQTTEIKGHIKTTEALISKLNKDLEQRDEEQKKTDKQLAELCENRRKLYGDKNPDEEELKINTAVKTAEDSAKYANANLEHLKLEQKELATKINTLTATVKQLKSEIKTLTEQFLEKCKKQGFKDENAFTEALLPQEKLSKLANFAKDLDSKIAKIAIQKEKVGDDLKTEEAKKLTDKPSDELAIKKAELEKTLAELRENLGAIRTKIESDKKAREKMKEYEKELKSAREAANKWGIMYRLIGSSEGKKFRNFAQGLTFQIMVSYANRQLKTMTDRYLLVRDKNAPLELNVIDNYQAGEERSTKNLSGGESFIVSLALALGLSSMASRNVNVDSLFLDEGFGTLDEESLETALESLSTLQQKNKLIGIISHVGALKERITTQINVTPLTGGNSEIIGPGCTKEKKTVQRSV